MNRTSNKKINVAVGKLGQKTKEGKLSPKNCLVGGLRQSMWFSRSPNFYPCFVFAHLLFFPLWWSSLAERHRLIIGHMSKSFDPQIEWLDMHKNFTRRLLMWHHKYIYIFISTSTIFIWHLIRFLIWILGRFWLSSIQLYLLIIFQIWCFRIGDFVHIFIMIRLLKFESF